MSIQPYSLISPAKINLYLEIVGDRPDGFHELTTIFQSIGLADRVHLRSAPAGIVRVHCASANVPNDASNLAYRAAALMAKTFPTAFAALGGVEIEIEKNIPVAAGLAGGSGNAAAVLVGLNLAWQLGLTQGELQDLGAELGSDVSFCVAGGTVLATGRGEQLDPLPPLTGLFVVLAKYASLSVSTPWAYQTYRARFGADYARGEAALRERQQRFRSGPMVQAIAHGSSTQDNHDPDHPIDLAAVFARSRQVGEAIGPLLRNDLERVALPDYPAIAHLRQVLAQAAPLGAMMSGSGPTVFALAESGAAAEAIVSHTRQAIDDPDLGLWVTQFVSAGIRLDPQP